MFWDEKAFNYFLAALFIFAFVGVVTAVVGSIAMLWLLIKITFGL